jgi:hypothetical protein
MYPESWEMTHRKNSLLTVIGLEFFFDNDTLF